MRVYIGPYRNRLISNVHKNYMNRKYGVDWPAKKYYTRTERFLDKLEDVLNWVYNHTVNRFLNIGKRKIDIRIDYYDTWNMDETLAMIILPMLKQLRDTKHGAPHVDDEDVPDELKSTSAPEKDHEWGVDDNHFKRWDYVLGEMIFAFENIVNYDWEEQFHSGTHDIKMTPVDSNNNEVSEDEATLFRMDKGPNDTHKFDREGYMKYSERIDNGTRLFGKYYRSLWD